MLSSMNASVTTIMNLAAASMTSNKLCHCKLCDIQWKLVLYAASQIALNLLCNLKRNYYFKINKNVEESCKELNFIYMYKPHR